jgi:hypothetical protein
LIEPRTISPQELTCSSVSALPRPGVHVDLYATATSLATAEEQPQTRVTPDPPSRSSSVEEIKRSGDYTDARNAKSRIAFGVSIISALWTAVCTVMSIRRLILAPRERHRQGTGVELS